ncbi:MAG: NADH-quinone oxidoreductase subunit G [Nocardiopsaceae bacterium]|jgi:NADH-quinone oxidoreductase subunit G|nr:NADH-quinone oxidoreductase subunit G [Nocardiopsaceae bacterium]
MTEVAKAADTVQVTIDGFEITVPKGTLIIRAAEQLGIQIPRFCDHPLLAPLGACRQCLVQVEGQPKPPASCTTVCTDGMVVRTQLTSPIAEKAQRGIMEMLLVNHPLDCPMCDKGGECPLQNQAMTAGQGETRFDGQKRTFTKPIALSAQVLLDRERCIQCARCTRFADEIAGDPLIELIERGPQEQVGIAEGVPFDSYFSGNTVQICPVGALTGAAYRFRARPFDLVSTPSVCEHCASGCLQRTDHRRGAVTRRLAGSAPEVNEEWNCDKGRWAFTYATMPDRLVSPLVRDAQGVLQPASWSEALDIAARGLAAARGRAGVLTGGRLTAEDAYAYSKFARIALASNDIDMRARPHSAEETEFLASRVAGTGMVLSYTALEQAPAVLLAGFEPEDESPIVQLRLRKAATQDRTTVFSIAALASQGLSKISGTLLPTPPGGEAHVLGQLTDRAGHAVSSTGGRSSAGDGVSASGSGLIDAVAQALSQPGSVILAGERLAESPGALAGAVALSERTGARLAWIPRRAGERGAIEAGAMPVLLPGGRMVTDAAARTEVARAWGAASLPAEPGRDTGQILAAVAGGEIGALVVAGVDPSDLPDPDAALAAIEQAEFVVSLELRASLVTDRADVIFPVAAVAEKPGTFVNWEGRRAAFEAAIPVPGVRGDLHVLREIADAMDVHLGLPDEAAARREIAALAAQRGTPREAGDGRLTAGSSRAGAHSVPGGGEALLATWHNLLDVGRMQDGEPNLAGTARTAVARMSAATAAEAGLTEPSGARAPDTSTRGRPEGSKVRISTSRGSIVVPVEITAMPDRVVWLPTNSAGCSVRRDLAAGHGSVVTVSAESAPNPPAGRSAE